MAASADSTVTSRRSLLAASAALTVAGAAMAQAAEPVPTGPAEIDLTPLTCKGLLVLFLAHERASDAYGSMYNEPRAKPVERQLEAEIDRLSGELSRIAEHVRELEPTDPWERECRAELLVRWALMIGAWPDLIAAASLKRDES